MAGAKKNGAKRKKTDEKDQAKAQKQRKPGELSRFQKVVIIIFIVIFAGSTLAGALASVVVKPYSFSGKCYRAFTTTGSVEKPASNPWQAFMVYADKLEYEMGAPHYYAYVQPVSSDTGASYGSRDMVYTTQDAYCTPNSAGLYAVVVKMKISNAYYVNTGDQDNQLTISGTVRAVYK